MQFARRKLDIYVFHLEQYNTTVVYAPDFVWLKRENLLTQSI